MLVSFAATRDINEGEELTVLRLDNNANGANTMDGGKTSDGGGNNIDGVGAMEEEILEGGRAIRVEHLHLLLDKRRRYLPVAMSKYCMT